MYKVISDNGYKIELIRSVREYPLRVGAKVDVKIVEDSGDLITLFNDIISEDTQNAILAKITGAAENQVK